MKSELAHSLLDLVKNNYQDIAEEFSNSRQKKLWPELYRFTKKVKNGDKVLDLACGNGRLLQAFKNKKIDYLGVDNSFNLIKIARYNYPKYRFILADMLNLEEIENNKFDYIFCIAAFHHIPSKKLREQALQEMEKKIKLDGEIIISVWNLWSKTFKKKKYINLILKNSFLKIINKNNLDFKDLVFPWNSPKRNIGDIKSKNKIDSRRYYHAFTKRELKKIVCKTKLNLKEIRKDKFNYYLVLKKTK